VTIAKNKQLLAEAGVVGPLVEVLKTHLESVEVMKEACGALNNVALDGELERTRGVPESRTREWQKRGQDLGSKKTQSDCR